MGNVDGFTSFGAGFASAGLLSEGLLSAGFVVVGAAAGFFSAGCVVLSFAFGFTGAGAGFLSELEIIAATGSAGGVSTGFAVSLVALCFLAAGTAVSLPVNTPVPSPVVDTVGSAGLALGSAGSVGAGAPYSGALGSVDCPAAGVRVLVLARSLNGPPLLTINTAKSAANKPRTMPIPMLRIKPPA